jgi:hypothetical protein
VKTRVARGLVACAALLGVTTACSSGNGSGLPSVSASFSPTRVLPSVTLVPDRSDATTPVPSADTGDDDGGVVPTVVPTVGPSEDGVETTPAVPEPSLTAAPSAVASEAATASDSGDGDSSGDSGDVWAWVVVGVLLVAAALLAWLLDARSRRRRTWEEGFVAARARVAWVGRELIPGLQATGSPDRAAGGWLLAQPQVTQIEAELAALQSSATTGRELARARTVGDAMRAVRAGIESAVVIGGTGSWTADLDTARIALETALVSASDGA